MTLRNKNYPAHETNYIFEYFGHLMTEVERIADAAIPCLVEDGEGWKLYYPPHQKIDFDVASVEFLLRDGAPTFRLRVSERLLSHHRAEIYARACPTCGWLPAPPRSRHCVWCTGDWYEQHLQEDLNAFLGHTKMEEEPVHHDLSPSRADLQRKFEAESIPFHLYFSEAQKRQILEADYARRCGWILEVNGKPVALLTDQRWEDMFWFSYQFTLITERPEMLARMESENFWYQMEGFKWRSQELGIICPNAFASGHLPPMAIGRALIRGLYFTIDPPPVEEVEVEPKNARERLLRWLKKITLG